MYRDALQKFVSFSSGVEGVIFVDSEGEAIDFVGSVAEYDLKVIGAHFSILFNTINGFDEQPRSLFVTMEPYVLGMYRLTKEYFLLVLYLSPYHAIINKFRIQELINFIKGSL
jgi:hypothetical protein